MGAPYNRMWDSSKVQTVKGTVGSFATLKLMVFFNMLMNVFDQRGARLLISQACGVYYPHGEVHL